MAQMLKENVIEIPISLIKHLDNSRLRVYEADLVPLMEDIKHRGLLQPIGLLKEGNNYILRFGNRRLQACKKLGWETVPAIISNRELDENSFMADNIAENLHRQDLTPIELANQCKSFIERGYSISEIASLLSIKTKTIKNALKISESAPETFKRAIGNIKREDVTNKKGKISTTVAGEILMFSEYLSDKEKNKLFEVSKKEELNAGQIRIIKNMMRNGRSLEQSLKDYKDYKMCAVELPLKIKELNKYKISTRELMRSFIKGTVSPNKKLL